MEYMVKDIGLRIRSARRDAGMTQAELASKAGIKQGSISDLERGESKSMRGPTLMAMSRALGVNEEWLQSGKGPQFPADPVRNNLTPEAIKVALNWMKLAPAVQKHFAELVQTMVKASAADTPAVSDERVELAFGKAPHKAK